MLRRAIEAGFTDLDHHPGFRAIIDEENKGDEGNESPKSPLAAEKDDVRYGQELAMNKKSFSWICFSFGEWERTFGGVESDGASSVQQTRDGGYIVAGSTRSVGAGNYDVYLIKLAPVGGFLRGDSNADGKRDVTDPIANLTFQFVGTFDPPCLDALDFDDSGELDVTDPIANLTHQFVGGPPPAAPGKEICGVDPTDDEIGCDTFAQCP